MNPRAQRSDRRLASGNAHCPCRRRRSPPTPTARCIGRSRACSPSPTCIWRKARALPRAASCCRLTTRRRRWRGSPASSPATRRAAWWRSATVSTTAAARRGWAMPTAHPLRAMQRGRDWIWITGNHDPEPADNIGGAFEAVLQDRRVDVPPSAGRRRRRNRRPSASGGARRASRPRRLPPLLCRRRQAHGDAGLRRLHRRAQRARRSLRRRCSARSPSPRICSATAGSMPSPPSAACRISA